MLLIIGLTVYGIVQFKSYRSTVYQDIMVLLGEVGPKGISCSSVQATYDSAYQSILMLEKLKQKVEITDKTTLQMYCYCQNELYSTFDTDMKFGNGKQYCKEWFDFFTTIQIYQLIPSLLIQVVNVASTFVFIFFAKYET